MFLLERILADGTRLYSKRGNEQKESQQLFLCSLQHKQPFSPITTVWEA